MKRVHTFLHYRRLQLALAGLGWLIYLSQIGSSLSMYLIVLGIVAEGSPMIRLLIIGLDEQRWNERVGEASHLRAESLRTKQLGNYLEEY